MKVNVINKGTNALPRYAKNDDWGMDIRADFSRGISEDTMFGAAYDSEREALLLFSGGRALIPTGLFTSFEALHDLEIRSRSGLALKKGVIVLNSPATIDAGYRSEIGVILMNLGDEVFEISHGDRIAQIGLGIVERIEWNQVDSLDDSDRGTTGFGDSGIK
jgi:dUTP pyrophosphatase